MKRGEVPSYPVSIFIAGDLVAAESVCAAYCDAVGLCVTVTATDYIYRDGEEAGVIVGLINYPRFPKESAELWVKAEALALKLREGLGQESFTIQAPDKTVWFSWRAADVAQGMSAGTAKTPKAVEGEARQPGREAMRPTSHPLHRENSNDG